MQSLVRETFQNLQQNLDNWSPDLKREAETLFDQRQDILSTLKRIYTKKLDVMKIRIHGNYDLRKIFLTGKDLAIQDFSGNPAQPFSERRLKRSPIRDVASMITSIWDTTYHGFVSSNQVQIEEVYALFPFAEQWAHYMSGFFVKAYLDSVRDTAFIPSEKEDLAILVQTFVLERALYSLNLKIRTCTDDVIVPLRIIQFVISQGDRSDQHLKADKIY
jgi:maltose alpha-D-glucosyltransferase/alpha-amylase